LASGALSVLFDYTNIKKLKPEAFTIISGYDRSKN
jgi:hypothetical protein